MKNYLVARLADQGMSSASRMMGWERGVPGAILRGFCRLRCPVFLGYVNNCFF